VRFFQPVVMLLGVATWILFFLYWGEAQGNGNYLLPFSIIGVWNLLVLIAAVVTIVDCVLKVRAKASRRLAADAMITKLSSVPFFVLNFLGLAAAYAASFALLLFGGPVLWVIVPFVGTMTYIVGLSTSFYGWAAIIQMRRERSLSKVLTVVFAILLFVPLADTVVGVLLFGRRRPRLALVVALLTVGVLSTVVGLLISALDIYPDGSYQLDGFGIAGFVVAGIGLTVILVTGIVALVRRTTLRIERREASLPTIVRIESAESEKKAGRGVKKTSVVVLLR
jgi:hypothetical protein